MTVLEALQRTALFKSFGQSGLQTLSEIAQARVIQAGAHLFVEDAEGDSLFVVISGTVRLTQRGSDGAEREIASLGPGAHLGELGLLTKTVRLVSAVAATECEVLELARRDFFKEAQKKPVTCLKLAAAIAAELAARIGENKQALRGLAAPKD
jgi:CRP-like cAMP-binding protein